jgi:eukaryotic-like serine/threonine-protein kinase
MNEAPPSQGLVAGKYQLVRLIGKGGMGSVWEAKHVSLGTPSAIKFIEAEYADSQEARSRFDKEAKAAATIQSKHAIQIYDHGVTDDGKPYIVMELLQGEPLDKTIERQRLSLAETAKIIQQVCRGLARAHERGIIHRDLKPENIFLVKTPDDDEPIAKVLDFGIAKMQGSPGASSGGLTSSTKTGAVLGTPFYMSPEQARGLRNVDHRADVWSLGVIAFKCVTGKLPFDGESVGDLLVKICTSPVPVPSQLYGGISPNFDAWFLRALEREPDRRFANVTELADALCFAAGIATRSQSGPFSGAISSSVPGVTQAQGHSQSHSHSQPHSHPQVGMTPHPNPHAATPGPAYGYPPPAEAGARTPPPGAMTNAPFTSESIPGVSGGRGKIIAGGILASVVAIAATVVIVFFFNRSKVTHSDSTNGVGVSPGTSTSASAPIALGAGATPPSTQDKPPEPPPAPPEPPPSPPHAVPPKAGAAAVKVAPKPPTPPTTSTPSSKPAPPPPPLPTPTTPAPAPTPTTKKPKSNDPGY